MLSIKLPAQRVAGLAGIAVMLMVSFFLWGCGGVPSGAAATVNGVVISKDDVAARIKIAQGISPQSVPADTSSEDYNNFQRDVTEQMVSEELEKQEAQKRGIAVEPAEIDAIMQQVIDDKYFGDVDKMSQDFEKRGLKEEDLRLEILRRLLHQKLLESLRQEVPVSEEEVRAQYEANKSSYVYPEKRQVRQIVVADEATARTVANRIASGEDFVTIAGQVSIDSRSKQNGGMLGLVTQSSLPQEVGDVAFSTEPNQVSLPFKSEQGWYIIRVEFVAPASNRSYEEVREELTRFMSNQKLSERYKEYVEEVKETYDVDYADDYSPREKTPGEIETPQPSLT